MKVENVGVGDALRLGANASVGVEEPGDGRPGAAEGKVDCIRSVGAWSKGEAPVFKHAFRVVMGVGGALMGRKRSIALERHRPRSRIALVSALAQSRVVAPPGRRLRVDSN